MSQKFTGNLPVIIQKQNQENAIDYTVYGDSDGSGVQTENLFDKNAKDTSNGYAVGAYLTSTGDTSSSSNHFITEYIELPIGSTRLGCYTGSTNVRACFYDTNKEFISSFVTGGSAGIPQNAVYVRATILKSKTDVAMMIPDITTAPESYIPFGYKIPISLESGVTENIFDINTITVGEFVRAGNTTSSSPLGDFVVNNDYSRSDYIPVLPNKEYTVVYTKISTALGAGIVFFSDSNQGSAISGVPLYYQNNQLTGYTFVTPSNCHYLMFSYDSSGTNTGKEMLVQGSTAPDHYIPHRYTSNYDLFIGSTKLGAEEYVDYQEQKVYKRTANIYDDAKTQWVNDVLDDNGQSTGGSTTSHYTDNFTRVLPEQTYYHNNTFIGTRRYYFYDQNKMWISRTNQIPEWQKHFTTPANCTYIRVQVPIQDASTNWCITADASSSYIPYLQPTDPPAPFPAITAYKGENTLSSTETVGNVSLEFNEATFYAGNNITQVYTNNQLYDLIDSSFYSLIANSYDSTQTYETDSYCIYNYCLYKCITAITTPEAFNPAKWQRLNVADCI